MQLMMVCRTKRDSELIGDLAAHSSGLRKAQVMRLRWSAAADKAGLRGDISEMLAITDPFGLANG